MCGLHKAGGSPSGAGTIGAASASNAQAKPATRINILTAYFILYFSYTDPLGAGSRMVRNISGCQEIDYSVRNAGTGLKRIALTLGSWKHEWQWVNRRVKKNR